MKLPQAVLLLVLSQLLFATALAPTKLPLPTKLIYQFPNVTWLENIAVRSNGQLLVGFGTEPALYSVEPDSNNPKPTLVYTFPNATAVFGISEVYPDVFAMAVGNFTWRKEAGVWHTWSVWKADFTGDDGPEVSKVTDIGEALWLNGMATVPGASGNVLISDSSLGAIWKLDVNTKKYEIAIQRPEMAPLNFHPYIGINGLRIHRDYAYFLTSNSASAYRIKLSVKGYALPGAKLELIGQYSFGLDDFAIDSDGIIWACTNLNHTVEALGPSGEYATVAGSSTELTVAGDTSAAFGRGKKDKQVLYVVTSGAWSKPVNGTITEGGKIVAVDTRGFHF
ncbi:Six-bladed beta-propeller TolB-like protein [Ilyonectria robusta]